MKNQSLFLQIVFGVCIVVIGFLAIGCTGTLTLKTHSQEWETRRDRYSLNSAVHYAEVKSLDQKRHEYKAARENQLAERQRQH